MCLIERLPAKTIDFPIAWTGGKFIGGEPTKPVSDEADHPKPVPKPVLAGMYFEDMGLPASQMGCRGRMMNIRAGAWNDNRAKESHGERGRKPNHQFDLRVTLRRNITISL